mmetsp:Transcript_14213/g.45667  ORF Transcript_14213/g.45667 Transcript_14213/m.45667 type:complete len:232 (+) Transcript_14213:463-1158(+)
MPPRFGREVEPVRRRERGCREVVERQPRGGREAAAAGSARLRQRRRLRLELAKQRDRVKRVETLVRVERGRGQSRPSRERYIPPRHGRARRGLQRRGVGRERSRVEQLLQRAAAKERHRPHPRLGTVVAPSHEPLAHKDVRHRPLARPLPQRLPAARIEHVHLRLQPGGGELAAQLEAIRARLRREYQQRRTANELVRRRSLPAAAAGAHTNDRAAARPSRRKRRLPGGEG